MKPLIYCGYFDFIHKIKDEMRFFPALANFPPTTYQKIYNESPKDRNHFSNDLNYIRHFDHDRVYVITKTGKVARLIDHPEYEKWKDEFDSAEFISVFGYDLLC